MGMLKCTFSQRTEGLCRERLVLTLIMLVIRPQVFEPQPAQEPPPPDPCRGWEWDLRLLLAPARHELHGEETHPSRVCLLACFFLSLCHNPLASTALFCALCALKLRAKSISSSTR